MSLLTSRELKHLSEETGLTTLSIQDWEKHFMNDCPTGSLSKERYINLYRSYYPRARNSDSYAQMFFTAFDQDCDLELHFPEFLRIVAITQGNNENAKLEIAYKAYNRNKSDTNLSRKHFRNVIISILDLIETQDDNDVHKKREIVIEWAMKHLGFDEKTEITKSEFIQCCKKDRSLYKFLAFSCVPKPNCSDGDLSGKEKYQISITTGTEDKNLLSMKSLSTNTKVFLILLGEKGSSKSIQLQQSHMHKNPFRYGNTDVFTQFLPSLGKIKGARLWHTGDQQQGWLVENLTVTNETLNITTYFPVQRWLHAGEYDKKTKVELIPNQVPGYDQ